MTKSAYIDPAGEMGHHVHARDALESLVIRTIKAHKVAVAEDEAAYGDDHEPIDEARAECTGRIESALFQAMAISPCLSHDDVQAKIHYLVTGSVGVRTTLIECFGFDEYGGDDVIAGFVKSLLVAGVPA